MGTKNQKNSVAIANAKNETPKMETAKKENSKIDLNAILSIGNTNLISKVRGGATLYNTSLFEGLNDKEKKHLRIKLRRKLDSFIASAFEFTATKKTEELAKLKTDWVEYATKIYIDINNICDANVSEKKREDVILFLQTMQKIK